MKSTSHISSRNLEGWRKRRRFSEAGGKSYDFGRAWLKRLSVGILIALIVGGFATPVPAITPQIAAGGNHVVVLKNDGQIWAWGNNYNGCLGNGTTTNSLFPVQVAASLTGVVKAITAGGDFTVALKDDGTVWAWGDNSDGHLGDGTPDNRYTPVQVKDSSGSFLTGITAISNNTFGAHTLALKNDGTVWAWGFNYHGQVGDGTTENYRTTAVQVKDSSGNFLTGITAITAGSGHSLALKNNGTVWAWGDNEDGQLGDGTTTIRPTAVQVATDLTGVVAAMDGGHVHTVALKNDGTVWAWGDNFQGQLGNGTTTDSSTPVQVKELSGNVLTDITAINAGPAHSFALKGEGTGRGWGDNYYGELGDSSTENQRTTAVQVSGLTGITAIAAGGNHYSVALTDDCSVWTWGHNELGVLGDGTTNDRSVPGKVFINLCISYTFSGFFPPVENPDTVNMAKAGQTIPIKWRITDSSGTAVSDPSSFANLTSYPVACDNFSGDSTDSVEEYAAGSSGLQYMDDGNWQYNWKTQKNYSNQCRTMVVTLKDGSRYYANFKFAK